MTTSDSWRFPKQSGGTLMLIIVNDTVINVGRAGRAAHDPASGTSPAASLRWEVHQSAN